MTIIYICHKHDKKPKIKITIIMIIAVITNCDLTIIYHLVAAQLLFLITFLFFFPLLSYSFAN